MLGLPVLDVAIGMAFLYLLFALMCTTLNEIVAGMLKKRPKMLREGLNKLLGSEQLTNALLEHPAIASLAPLEKKRALPSYIPAERFAQALTDHITGNNPVTNMAAARAGIEALPGTASRQLKALLDLSPEDAGAFQNKIADWYNEMMDRVSGWYKRYIQKQTYVLAVILVLWLNLDSVHLVQRLWSDSALRAVVVEQAKTRIQATSGEELPVIEYTEGDQAETGHPVQTGTVTLSDQEQKLLSSLTGWQTDLAALQAQRQLQPGSTWLRWFGGVLQQHVLGWILTVLAISLGAPFWFDILNRFMNIRNAGRAPDEPRSKISNTPKTAGAASHA